MKRVELKEIIAKGEGENVEFKRSFGRECIEAVCAFANTRGGTVLIGVVDGGEICGVSLSEETVQQWCNEIKTKTSPAVIPDVEVFETQSGSVILLRVDEYPVKPVNFKGRYYKRVKNSNHQMNSSEVATVYLATFNLSWDAYAYPNASLDQLDDRKIKHFIDRVNRTRRFVLDDDPVSSLRKLHLIRENDAPTGAAMLLFAKDPLPFRIHIGRFKTPSMIIDDKQVEGTLFESVEEAMTILIGHIHVAFDFDGSIQRKETFQYSLEAIRETLLNAVVHRDYTNPSDIVIKVFDDRIVFYNPGKLYGDLTVEDLHRDDYHSQLRNKLVAESFYLTGDIEKYGSGFVRMRGYLKDAPGTSMTYCEAGNGFEVIHLPNLVVPESESRPESRPESRLESPLAEKVIVLLGQREAGKMEISKSLGHKTVSGELKKQIKRLLNMGLIEMTIPEKPNSRLQKYRITDKGREIL